MKWLCNARTLIVIFILVVFISIFLMSAEFQRYWYGMEGFALRGYNHQLVHYWDASDFRNTWKRDDFYSADHPDFKKWMVRDILNVHGKKLDHRNSSISFWLYVQQRNGSWGHVLSFRGKNSSRYFLIEIRPHTSALHIRADTGDNWNEGASEVQETGKPDQTKENNHIPENRAVFVTVSVETPQASPAQLAQNNQNRFESTYRLYVDGVLKNSHVFDKPLKSSENDTETAIYMGSNSYGTFALKDVEVYNHTMTSVDAMDLYRYRASNGRKSEEAKSLFVEGFGNHGTKEGFVSAAEADREILPEDSLDFYKLLKLTRANSGKQCKYSFGGNRAVQTVAVGPSSGKDSVTIDGKVYYTHDITDKNIPQELSFKPTYTNESNPTVQDSFLVIRKQENGRDMLYVHRNDHAGENQGWGMPLTLETYSDVTKENFDWERYYDSNRDFKPQLLHNKDDVWNHWVTYGRNEGRTPYLKDQAELMCGREHPLCVGSNNGQYGMCGKELSLGENEEFVLKTTYTNNGEKRAEDDPQLIEAGLTPEDTLDGHFDAGKTMRFVVFGSNADWRKNGRVPDNKSPDQAKQESAGKYFDRIHLRNLRINLGNNGMTFCLWFRMKSLTSDFQQNTNDPTTWGRLFDLGNGYGNQNIVMAFHDKKLAFYVSSTGNRGDVQDVVDLVDDNEWYHVAWVIGPDTGNLKCTWKVYVNGVLKKTLKDAQYPEHSVQRNPIIRENLYIGASNYWWDPHFVGGIADARIYKGRYGALNANQVYKVYSNPDPK